MAVSKTSLSAGDSVNAILRESAEVRKRVTKIFPIVALDKAVLPYISYRQIDMEIDPVKQGKPGADTIQMEVVCYAAKYGECLELAEAVRDALDNIEDEHNGLRIRSCNLTGGTEDATADAYITQLIFTIKI